MLEPDTTTSPAALRRLTLFTGSASGREPRYAAAVRDLAGVLAGRGVGVVYGGGRVGLMGELADAALGAGGEVLGVMPRSLVDGEIAHPGLTRLDVVADMHERKQRMGELGDGFVALPGGAGTLEELFEVWTWQQLGIHAKPVALYDVDGFWQPLLRMVDHMVDEGFLSSRYRESLVVARSPQGLLDALAAWEPPAAKWGR
ncbi:TIGR00730 family Rossman fold protein [Isoptericola sp. NPDC057653]|uniref:LOG family protein n=1 Tax=unclassified Isoptericola TaxID=2623355 RepID=UPI0036CC675D